jgi:hypothetical protein
MKKQSPKKPKKSITLTEELLPKLWDGQKKRVIDALNSNADGSFAKQTYKTLERKGDLPKSCGIEKLEIDMYKCFGHPSLKVGDMWLNSDEIILELGNKVNEIIDRLNKLL